MIKLRFLATGLAHSGTGYVAKVLTSMGIVCGHEHIFRMSGPLEDFSGDGPWGHPWNSVQAESSWPAIEHLDHPYVKGAHIIHVVRNPLHVIESHWKTRYKVQTLDALRKCLFEFEHVNMTLLAAKERRPYSLCRVEDGPFGLARIVDRPVWHGVFQDTSYNSHMHDRPREFSSWDIIEDQVGKRLPDARKLAKRLGYP
jgi:hypothetical protein